MKVTRVGLAANNNPIYLDFWNFASKIWNKYMGIIPTLYYISDHDNPNISTEWGEVVRYTPDPKYTECYCALVARWMNYIRYPDEVSIVGDLDMVPLNKGFWSIFSGVPDNVIAITSPKSGYTADHRIQTCYQATLGSVYTKAFGLTAESSIKDLWDKFYEAGLPTYNSHRRPDHERKNLYGFDEVAATWFMRNADATGIAHLHKIRMPSGCYFLHPKYNGFDHFKQIDGMIKGTFNPHSIHAFRPLDKYKNLHHFALNTMLKTNEFEVDPNYNPLIKVED